MPMVQNTHISGIGLLTSRERPGGPGPSLGGGWAVFKLPNSRLDELNQAFATKLGLFQLPPSQSESTHSTGPVTAGPVFSDSPSPRNYARDPQAVPIGRLGGEEEPPAGTPSEPAPVLVLCATCRQPIRWNEVLGISFCPIHGLSQPFTFIPLARRRLPGA